MSKKRIIEFPIHANNVDYLYNELTEFIKEEKFLKCHAVSFYNEHSDFTVFFDNVEMDVVDNCDVLKFKLCCFTVFNLYFDKNTEYYVMLVS